MQQPYRDEDVVVAKKMFYGGFAFLPFLWLVNGVFFRQALTRSDAPPALKYCTCPSYVACVSA